MFGKKSYSKTVWATALLLSLIFISSSFSQEGTWASKSPMPTPRMVCSANTVDGIIYVIGGTDDPNVGSLVGVSTVEAYDPATDSWTTKTPMPGPRTLFASCVLNDKIYIIGGQRQQFTPYLDIMEEYDPLTDTWTTKTPMPDKRSVLCAAAVGDKIYVIGGFGTEPVDKNPLASVLAYDPATDTWEYKAPMSKEKSAMGIAVHNDKIYVFSGAEGFGPFVSIVEEYDPATDTWTQKNDSPFKTWCTTSGVVDGKIYALGGATTGFNTFTPSATVNVYDPATDSWENGPAMPLERFGHASCTANHKIYVFGGTIESGPNFNITPTVHEFTPPEPETGPWATKAPMPTPRMVGSAHNVNDIIYVIGGTDDPNLGSLTGVATVEAYDPETDSWTTKTPMPGPRIAFASCVLDEKIYIIGGQRKNYSDYLDIVEVYDPHTNTWTSKAPMPELRDGACAAAVGGKVYVIGGFGMEPEQYNPLASVIAYDPATDSWENKAPMSIGRCVMGIAVHNDKIYVMGGAEGFGPLVSIVEEYDPATNIWTRKSDIPTKRWWLSSCAVDGKIYAMGGATTGWDTFTPTETVEVYDPVTDSWSGGINLPIPSMGNGSCVCNGKIYVFGGSSESGPTFNITSTVHEFTPTITQINDTTPTKNPASFSLKPNYPNPFNPSTTIDYTLPQPGQVTLSIYNLFGQHVQTLVNEKQNAGTYSHIWNATDETGNKVSSGIYLYRIKFTDFTGREAWREERKMLLLK